MKTCVHALPKIEASVVMEELLNEAYLTVP